MNRERLFRLSDEFIERYERIIPPFGFNGLGEMVYMHHYSRIMPNGKKERWVDTIRRVVEGTWDVILDTVPSGLAEASAREMFDRMFSMKFLPPGRGLWAMGTDIPRLKGGAALNNCAFISTSDFVLPSDPFVFAMDMLMMGVGVGFDTKGAERYRIRSTKTTYSTYHQIQDTREGWVLSLKVLLDSYFITTQDGPSKGDRPMFSYALIRKKGEPLKIFGGRASGPGALMDLHKDIEILLTGQLGRPVTQKLIVDIMNLIGRCVVAGNVRRSAELAIGSGTPEFLDLKDYEKNPDRSSWGWCSNNSVFADHTTDYGPIAARIAKNGEPGLLWLENMKLYGRMMDGAGSRDRFACGSNPCAEQTLESGELCCLVEVFIANHAGIHDFFTTLWHAYHYAKAVTLIPVHNTKTQKIITRNRRIGISVTGIAQFLSDSTLEDLRVWLESGYAYISGLDAQVSREWNVNQSIKLTCIKPSGTVSLLAGATPGMHFPLSRFYWRRMRLANGDDKLVNHLQKSGYQIDSDPNQKRGWVASFAVDVGDGVRTLDDVGMWEQLALAAFLQRHWADNQVSCTVTFGPDEAKHIATALQYYGRQLKSISFLPRGDDVYPLMPYQKITREQFEEYMDRTVPLRLDTLGDDVWKDPEDDTRCDGGGCEIIELQQ